MSQTPAQTMASPAASPAAVPDPTAVSTQSPPPKPTRPEGVPESFWDKDKGELKASDWGKSYEELRSFKAAEDARRASIPAQADLYKPELPKDFKVPQGMELKTDDPLYVGFRDYALKNGMTQEAFSEGIGLYAKVEIAKQEALQAAVKARDAALGPNGPVRVDDLNKRFVAYFGEEVGKQFAQTLFTPGIIQGFEKVFATLSSQGVQKFSSLGREATEGRADGLPDNWETMSTTDKRTYQLTAQRRKSAA